MLKIQDINKADYRTNPLWILSSQLRKKPYSGIVYMYKNNANGKVYIGQTTSPHERHKAHLYESYSVKSKDYNVPFHNAIRKYGINAFDYYILHQAHADTASSLCNKLNSLEKKSIVLYKAQDKLCGYNIQPGGTEYRYKTPSKSRPVNQYSIEGIMIRQFQTLTDAAKNVGGVANVIRESCKSGGRAYEYRWSFANENLKPMPYDIHQYDADGNYMQTYDNMVVAAKAIKTSFTGISYAAKNKTHLCCGYYWRKEKYDSLPFSDFPNAVVQYDLDGNYIKWFPSVKNAVVACNASGSSSICGAIKRHTAYRGFLWRKELLQKIEPFDDLRTNTQVAVIAVFPDNSVKKYKSILEASQKTHIDKSTINRATRHLNTHSTNGIIFYRESEYNKKYGDRVKSTN